MGFLQLLKNGLKFIQKQQNALFTYDVNKQKRYLAHFKEPIDDVERGYFQYRCQVKLMGNVMGVILNVGTFFTMLIYLLKLAYLMMFKGFKKLYKEKDIDAVFLSNDIPHNILPLELQKKFPVIKYENNDDFLNLNLKDIMFILQLVKRYPFSWHFIFKCLIKISMYSARMHNLHPKAIITYSEFSFTSSVLTAYCEENHVKHINVMHGQKLFYMRDSFFHFHECYIWDDFYKDLFIKLKAEPNQFTVALPQSIKFDKRIYNEKEYDFTYYLAGEQKGELEKISYSLAKLQKEGYKISIRPHPRYTDLVIAKELFSIFEIEDPRSLTIEDSILRTKSAISLYSTVLYQAYQNGVEPIIDNVTNPQKYDKLCELQYDILSKKHLLLSKLIKD